MVAFILQLFAQTRVTQLAVHLPLGIATQQFSRIPVLCSTLFALFRVTLRQFLFTAVSPDEGYSAGCSPPGGYGYLAPFAFPQDCYSVFSFALRQLGGLFNAPSPLQTGVWYTLSGKIARIYLILLDFHCDVGFLSVSFHSRFFTLVCEPFGWLIWMFTPDLVCLQWLPYPQLVPVLTQCNQLA